MFQIGGGNCSICNSPGTNKSTCPCNPAATKPNPAKHPLCKKGTVAKKATSPKVSPPKPTPKISPPKPTPFKKVPTKKTLHLKKKAYLSDLPPGILETMIEQGLDYEDLISLRQTAKGVKLGTEKPAVKKLARELKSAPVYDKTQKKYPVVIEDPEGEYPTVTLNKSDFLPAWKPIVKPYSAKEKESPYDEKILGTPLFFEGDKGPQYYDDDFSFYAQFYDPNPKSPFGKDLIQIYIADIDDIEGNGSQNAIIRRISRQEIESKKPITPPEVKTNDTINSQIHNDKKSGKIIGWNKIDTILFEDILAKGEELGEELGERDFMDIVDNLFDKLNIGTGGDLSSVLQISGVPSSWQDGSKYYLDHGVYFNELYNGYWGDGGSLHSTIKGEVFGDMA